MRIRSILLSLAVSAIVPVTGMAQDAESIMRMVREKQVERWEGVEAYMIDQTLMGTRTQSFFTRAETEDSQGTPLTVFRPNFGNSDGCETGQPRGLADATPDELDQIADAYDMTGNVMGTEIENGLEAAGLPRGLLAATGSDPWATFDPRVMLGGGARMFRGLADAKRQRAIEDMQPDDSLLEAEEYIKSAKLVGTEMIDGRKAYHIRAENLNLSGGSDDQSMHIHTVNMWVDAEMYVPLQMTMEGTAKTGREIQPVKMDRKSLDYRQVPDSKMYESYRQESTISGVMDAKQQAEMQQAQQQMAELQTQLAQMPAAQRDMIMRQMGPQMEMMKSMSSGGGIVMSIEVHDIVVNYCDRDEPVTRTVSLGGATLPSDFTTPIAGGGAGSAAYNLRVDEEDVEVRPYYIDKEGIGVLRYSEPGAGQFQYHMVISGLTTDPDRPREVLVGSMGPYMGPDVAIYMGSMNMLNVPLELIEIELYENEPYRTVVRFRPVVDVDKAEGMAECGNVSSIGACSNTATQ